MQKENKIWRMGEGVRGRTGDSKWGRMFQLWKEDSSGSNFYSDTDVDGVLTSDTCKRMLKLPCHCNSDSV